MFPWLGPAARRNGCSGPPFESAQTSLGIRAGPTGGGIGRSLGARPRASPSTLGPGPMRE